MEMYSLRTHACGHGSSTGTVIRHNGVIGMSLLTLDGVMAGKLGVSDFIPKNVTNTEYGIIIAHIR